jgi:hypothetical protein
VSNKNAMPNVKNRIKLNIVCLLRESQF